LAGRLSAHLSVAALKDRAHGVAWLRHAGEIDGGLGRAGLRLRGGGAAVALEVRTDTLGLILFDGARMRLAGDADGLECVENRPALYFQFACQIVDSNFVHPSLFASLCAPLAGHTSLVRSGSGVVSIMAEFRVFAANSVDVCERPDHAAICPSCENCADPEVTMEAAVKLTDPLIAN